MAETNYSKYENGPVGAFNKIVEAKEGQVIGAIQKEGMGKIDYVWGKNGKSGYGLAHITEKHTNITGEILAEILSNGEIKYVSFNNTANIEHKDGIAAVRLDWDRREKKWVVTAFIDESRPSTGTADTDKAKGGANETIPGTKPAPNLTQDNGGTGKSQDKSGDRETCYKLAPASVELAEVERLMEEVRTKYQGTDQWMIAPVVLTNLDALTSRVRTRVRYESKESSREIPDAAIIKGHNRALPTLIALWQRYQNNDRVDFYMADNNVDGRKPITVFRKVSGEISVYNDNLFALLQTPIKLSEGGKYANRKEGSIDKGYFVKHQDEIDRRVKTLKASKAVSDNVLHGQSERSAGTTGADTQELEGSARQVGPEAWTSQIKSATANVGAFNRENADIRYKLFPEEVNRKFNEEIQKYFRGEQSESA